MRVLTVLFGLSSVWAQYRLIGTQVDVPKKAELRLELVLTPTFVRMHSQGQWDTLEVGLDFVFTAQKAYWLDHKARIAYEVELQKADSALFFQVERLGSVEVAGQVAERIRFRLPLRRIEVVWAEALPFDWQPWIAPLGNSELALIGQALRRGVPLRIEVYDEAGQLLSAMRIDRIEKLPRPEPFSPPYPVRRLGQ